MAIAARPRVVENDHLNVKNIRCVYTKGFDDGTLRQRIRIRREKYGGGVHKRPKWDDCKFFFDTHQCFGSPGKEEDTYSHHDLDLVELGLTKFHNLRMLANRELRGPLMEGVLRWNPWLPRVVVVVVVRGRALALDERKKDAVSGGNEGETFGSFQLLTRV